MATQIFFIFTPIPGGMIQFDEHIFQMGWFNHQLVLNHLRVIFGDLFCPPVFCWGLWFLTDWLTASQVTQSFEWAASFRLSKLGVPKKIGLESQLAHGNCPQKPAGRIWPEILGWFRLLGDHPIIWKVFPSSIPCLLDSLPKQAPTHLRSWLGRT